MKNDFQQQTTRIPTELLKTKPSEPKLTTLPKHEILNGKKKTQLQKRFTIILNKISRRIVAKFQERIKNMAEFICIVFLELREIFADFLEIGKSLQQSNSINDSK